VVSDVIHPTDFSVLLPDRERLVRTSAHQNNEDNGPNDRDEDRTDATETIGKESEHTALSCRIPTVGLAW
jgi:hypothetical protein